jgi:hypothetical protein
MEVGEAFSTDYWLGHCEGFRVDSPGGFVGIVEEVVFSDPLGGARALVVVGRRPGARRWLVAVGDVAVVQPVRERVSLDSTPTEGLQRETNGLRRAERTPDEAAIHTWEGEGGATTRPGAILRLVK